MSRCAACGNEIDRDDHYCTTCEEYVEPISDEEYEKLFGEEK